MSEKLIVGIDIGGTKVAAGLVNAHGDIIWRNRSRMVTTSSAASGLAVVTTAIRNAFESTSPAEEIVAIGVCCPGALDPHSGVVINPVNIGCWRDFPLADEIKRGFDVPVKIDNDANAAALAEAVWGAGIGYRNLFYAALGTGIGTGIVLDGKIYHGSKGAAGEGGHMGIDMNGPLCPCGKRGCIEIMASGPAIARRACDKLAQHPDSALLQMANGSLQHVTSEMVGWACQTGDVVAGQVIDETLNALGFWLANIIDLLDPGVIVVGGGVSSMLGPFLDEVRQRWRRACVNPSADAIPLVLARYGEDAGIAGAAALVQR